MDGVLYLTGVVPVALAKDASNTFRVMGFNDSPEGIIWEISRVVVTNNYYLDPAKYRKIENHYSIVPTIMPTLYGNYLLMGAQSDAFKFVAFNNTDDNLNLNAIGFTPKYMSYCKESKRLALAAENSNQVVVYDTSVTPWVGSIAATLPEPVVGLLYTQFGDKLLVTYINTLNRIVDRLYRTSDFTQYITINDQIDYTGTLPYKRAEFYYSNELYIINVSGAPHVMQYSLDDLSVYLTTPRTLAGVSKITAIARKNLGSDIAVAVTLSNGTGNAVRIYDSSFSSSFTTLAVFPGTGVENEIVDLAWAPIGDRIAYSFANGNIGVHENYWAGAYPIGLNQPTHTASRPNLSWSITGTFLAASNPDASGVTLYSNSTEPLAPIPAIFEGDMFYTPNNGPGGAVSILYIEGAAAPGAIQPPV